MAGESALETGARVIAVLRSASTTMRHLYTYLVAHEKAVVVFGDTLLGSSRRVELLKHGIASRRQENIKRNTRSNTHDKAISNLQLNIGDGSDLTEAAPEVVLPRMLGKTSNIDFIWLRRSKLTISLTHPLHQNTTLSTLTCFSPRPSLLVLPVSETGGATESRLFAYGPEPRGSEPFGPPFESSRSR